MREPCPNCPFRTDSQLGYDADAMEALDAEYEPCCHAVVGPQAIFANGWPASERESCAGFAKWLAGEPGYQKPEQIR